MQRRTLTISLRALCLLPALALAACDPKLNLGDLFEEGGQSEGTDETSNGTGGQSSTSTSTGVPVTSGGDSSGDPPAETGETGETGDIGETGETGETGGGGCDLWTQDCPPGEKCVPYREELASTWNALKCVPIDPVPVPVGSPCENPGVSDDGLDNCEEGSMCWEVDPGTGIGTCVAHCQGTPQSPICPTDTSCIIAENGVLTVCLSDCDPLAQDCPAGNVCVGSDKEDFFCAVDASGTEGQLYDICEYINACDPGFACRISDLSSECDTLYIGCCLPFCDLDDPNTCPGAGHECVPWYDVGQAPPGAEDIGVCQLPV